MAIKDWTSRELPRKGEYFPYSFEECSADKYSFGWVNASYVYGLQICNAHMRRALGACTPYDTFVKATEATTPDEV